ncbi:histidine kinase [Lacinutrix sp. 5H-3-7-4]|uniref:sensor histidine kinase n=1 Tax=Lacinutrix sp. (strain 5H-3-7-4) TaxID=983544 RepID=UPI00020A34E4|nr:histidine kinase [Lacinutrix sp. 5H-3-7-4]AEH02637.1 putative signal transduction histidine kinase [Lacinutrix sp. 5H-3-7-4]
MSRFIIYILFLINICLVQAQNPVFVPMSNVSKLPDVEFYDVIEDQQHYIWLAADKGLYRYNGKNYKHFSHPKQRGNSLFQLKFDAKNRLWCNNIYGQLFYVENSSLKLFYDASKLVNGQLANFEILENSIRLFTVIGIFDIDKSTKKVTEVFKGMCITNAKDGNNNYTFVINFEGDLERHRLYKFDSNTDTKILEITSSNRIQSPRIFAFKNIVFFTYKSSSGNLIYRIDKTKNTSKKVITPARLKNEIFYNVLNIENEYWFLTSSGVFVYRFENEIFTFKEQLFKTESITDVQVDFNNNYWFTTLDNGVFVVPNLNVRRTSLEFIDAKITASLALQNNQFVLGTNDGKLLFYNHNQLTKTLQLPGKKIIGKLFFDAQSEKLIVSINASESFVVNLKNDEILDVNNQFSVAKTFSKIDVNTLFYGNYRQGIVYKNPFNNPKQQILKESRVKASVVSNNHLFVSYIDGLYKYNTQTFNAEEITFNSKSLLVNTLTKTNGTVWVATQHNGLLKYENNTLKPSGIKLPENLQINAIYADGLVLWISTDAGLFQYHTKTHQLKSLSAQDGLNTAVNDFLILQNQIIVNLPKAFYTLPKSGTLFKDLKTAKVRVEAIKINDRDTVVKNNYKLPHNYNKIGLAFNSNGFQSNQHVNYQYRVKEIDTSWQNLPVNTHFVNFNSLSSGTYTFELKAQNLSAKQAVFATPITFIIAKPFWETYWFYGLVIATIIGLVWLYFRWRLQQKEVQRIAEIDRILTDKKITNLRLENLRSQMNPHFIFNALNSIQDYIISNEKELASSYLVKFSRLIRMYLDYSQQNEITLEEELNALKLYLELEKVRFEDELEYKITIDNQLKTKQIKVPSLFIQPYVENALKHGLLHKLSDRKLHIKAKIIQQNKLEITVKDNGIGRAQSEKLKRPNQQHKPFATKANEERVHLYKNKLKRDIAITTNDLYDENDVAAGTKVVITMPIH